MKIYNVGKWQLFLVILLFCSKLPAQEQDVNKIEYSKSMADKLKHKILLSDEQVKQVEKILTDYLNTGNRNEQNSADKKIEALMDEKQKIKFEIIKDDWWREINRALGS